MAASLIMKAERALSANMALGGGTMANAKKLARAADAAARSLSGRAKTDRAVAATMRRYQGMAKAARDSIAAAGGGGAKAKGAKAKGAKGKVGGGGGG